MTEESEKVLGLDRLPIFPLPLVLMPHELLPLHIFEPRYRKMLEDVAVGKNLFGVSFFESKDELNERPSIGHIGCVAEIRESETLTDGRSNILTVGVIRYQILNYPDTDSSYDIAEVDFFEDADGDDDASDKLADEVFALFNRVALAAHRMSGQKRPMPEIPKAPAEQLSFLVASSLNLPIEEKFKLIETTSTSDRLVTIRSKLTESVKLVEESAKIEQVSRTNGHANKKIDLGP